MANTRFLITNLLELATIKNGGGGAPARDEIAPTKIEDAVNSDRYSVWRSSPAGNQVDFDLTAGVAINIPVQVGVVLVARHLLSVDFTLDPTGSYPPPYTLISTIPFNEGQRNGVAVAIGPTNSRFASFILTSDGSEMEVGRLVVGSIDTDIGIISSPGYDKTTTIPRQEYRTWSGVPVSNYGIAPYKVFSIPYNNITTATKTKLEQLALLKQTVILIDHTGTVYECRVEQWRDVQVWGNPALFNGTLEMTELP